MKGNEKSKSEKDRYDVGVEEHLESMSAEFDKPLWAEENRVIHHLLEKGYDEKC